LQAPPECAVPDAAGSEPPQAWNGPSRCHRRALLRPRTGALPLIASLALSLPCRHCPPASRTKRRRPQVSQRASAVSGYNLALIHGVRIVYGWCIDGVQMVYKALYWLFTSYTPALHKRAMAGFERQQTGLADALA